MTGASIHHDAMTIECIGPPLLVCPLRHTRSIRLPQHSSCFVGPQKPAGRDTLVSSTYALAHPTAWRGDRGKKSGWGGEINNQKNQDSKHRRPLPGTTRHGTSLAPQKGHLTMSDFGGEREAPVLRRRGRLLFHRAEGILFRLFLMP